MGDFTFNLNQDVPLSPRYRPSFVLHLLETRIASILILIIVVVALVLRTSHSLVFTIRPLELDTGSQHCALQKDVALRVSGGDGFDELFWNPILMNIYDRCCHLAKSPWQLS